ncbi:MAG: hypothetical protein IJ980_02480, partial [Oscillospiraceae bacterium]|nr:hypothetical protein [Oscillospiraceae bacterium]
MNNLERMNAEMAYKVDDTVREEVGEVRRLVQKLNSCDWADADAIAKIMHELIDAPEGAVITPPFYC